MLYVFVAVLCLKDLNSRAQAEVTIREALRELDLWGAAATFNLTEYTDSSKRTLTLIKDWKDVVNQVDMTQAHTCINTQKKKYFAVRLITIGHNSPSMHLLFLKMFLFFLFLFSIVSLAVVGLHLSNKHRKLW